MDDKVRLIDAEALKNYMCSACPNKERCEDTEQVCSAILDVDEQPTIEAEPVKHGRWELISQNKFTGTKTLRCTYCKNYFVIQDNTLNAGRGDANFCPNCGSKNRMDGDGE